MATPGFRAGASVTSDPNSPSLPGNLQQAFIDNGGAPVALGAEQIVQADRWTLTGDAVVEIRFTGKPVPGASVRLSIRKPGRILLSDGSPAAALAVYDQRGLPRSARHRVRPNGSSLLVYNAYAVMRGGRSFEESWTGNAGMIVTRLAEDRRRYECSDGTGAFARGDLVFEIGLLGADAPLFPDDAHPARPGLLAKLRARWGG